jgi:hypothetical protein
MSGETKPTTISGTLYGVRLFFLTITVADILGNTVAVSRWARFVLDHFTDVRIWISEHVSAQFVSWFQWHISWNTKQNLPVLMVLLAELGLGLARRRGTNASRNATARQPLRGLTTLGAAILTLGLYFANDMMAPPLPGAPASWLEHREQCGAVKLSSFSEKCIIGGFKTMHAESWLDYAISALLIVSMIAVVIYFPLDVIAATVAAALFLALGMINLKPFWGMG